MEPTNFPPQDLGIVPDSIQDDNMQTENTANITEETTAQKTLTQLSDLENDVVENQRTTLEVEPQSPEVEIGRKTIDESELKEEAIDTVLAESEIGESDYANRSREQLVQLLEETVKNENINSIKSKITQIKVAYIALANSEHQAMYQKAAESTENEQVELYDPLEERFKAAFNTYKHNKARFTEDQERQKVENLNAKNKILEELKVLISSEETLKKTYDEFKILQEKWKNFGMVPKSDAQSIWQNYHFLIEKFFDKVKINKELKDLDLRKNLERKIELCEKVEELLLESSVSIAFKKAQELREEWKESGPVSQEKRDEIWDRFKTASDKINERRQEYYLKIQGDLEANYAAKLVLCEKIEQLVAENFNSLQQWQESTLQINELLKLWKSIGHAPQKTHNEIWNRFKTQLNNYFNNKKEFFEKIKDEQLHNYNLKVDLCFQAEAHKQSTDWKNSSRELIRLQEEWKKIGAVPRKNSEKIWKRFRSACDEFFSAKNEHFKEEHANEGTNLHKKLDILAQLSTFEFAENRQDTLSRVKDLQREWMETGHVPIKEKDRIQTEFKTAVNAIYDKLRADSNEINTTNYRSRFENTKDQPEASRIIGRERSGLQTKIESLKEEIMLWENNIGFFAKSKQANLLKAEFESKIQRAKDELLTLENKVKILKKIITK